MIREVRDELAQAALDHDVDAVQASAVTRAIAAGARAAGLEVLTLDDLADIADAIPRPREEPW